MIMLSILCDVKQINVTKKTLAIVLKGADELFTKNGEFQTNKYNSVMGRVVLESDSFDQINNWFAQRKDYEIVNDCRNWRELDT
jgi:hypothetical protein